MRVCPSGSIENRRSVFSWRFKCLVYDCWAVIQPSVLLISIHRSKKWMPNEKDSWANNGNDLGKALNWGLQLFLNENNSISLTICSCFDVGYMNFCVRCTLYVPYITMEILHRLRSNYYRNKYEEWKSSRTNERATNDWRAREFRRHLVNKWTK